MWKRELRLLLVENSMRMKHSGWRIFSFSVKITDEKLIQVYWFFITLFWTFPFKNARFSVAKFIGKDFYRDSLPKHFPALTLLLYDRAKTILRFSRGKNDSGKQQILPSQNFAAPPREHVFRLPRTEEKTTNLDRFIHGHILRLPHAWNKKRKISLFPAPHFVFQFLPFLQANKRIKSRINISNNAGAKEWKIE